MKAFKGGKEDEKAEGKEKREKEAEQNTVRQRNSWGRKDGRGNEKNKFLLFTSLNSITD